MGLLDRFRGRSTGVKAAADLLAPVEWLPTRLNQLAYIGNSPFFPTVNIAPARVYGDFSAIRTVIDFLANTLAATPLRAYTVAADGTRTPLRTGPVVTTLRAPAPGWTQQRLLGAIVKDRLLYDRWCLLKTAQPDGSVRLGWMAPDLWWAQLDALASTQFVWWGVGQKVQLAPAAVALSLGYSVSPLAQSTPPTRTIQSLVGELEMSARYRSDTYENGARVPGTINRAADAPDWTPDQRNRFLEDFRAQFTGSRGSNNGGWPLLEDGMNLAKVEAFSADDLQYAEVATLTLVQVANYFHVAPELVGARPGTYSNVESFREQLYGDTLGPLMTDIEQTLQAMLLPDLDPTGTIEIRFDTDAKIRGGISTLVPILNAAAGAPMMTRNEARAVIGLKPLTGGDQLITPLNVVAGGQPSSSGPGSQPANPATSAWTPRAKAATPAPAVTDVRTGLTADLAAFHGRQKRSVMSRLGAGDAMGPLPEAFDAARWNTELADTIRPHAQAAALAGAVAALGLPDDTEITDTDTVAGSDDLGTGWSPAKMLAYLSVVAASRATSVNTATYSRLAGAVTAPDWKSAAGAVFDDNAAHADGLAGSITADTAGFGSHDAASAGGAATKTWSVQSDNPRPTHAELDGQSVALSDTFSNGLRWPGDNAGDAAETAGCTCAITYDFPDEQEEQ